MSGYPTAGDPHAPSQQCACRCAQAHLLPVAMREREWRPSPAATCPRASARLVHRASPCPWCCNNRSSGAEEATKRDKARRHRSRPAASSSRAFQTIVPEPVRSFLYQPLSIGPTEEGYGGDVDRRGGHERGWRRLVAADGQHHAVERIAVENFDEAEIGEVPVERGA